jgi:hypothetical protein
MQSSPTHGVVVLVGAGSQKICPGTQSVAGGGSSGVGIGTWLVSVGSAVDVGVGVEALGVGCPVVGAAPALTAMAVNTATDNTPMTTAITNAARTRRLPEPAASTPVGDSDARVSRAGFTSREPGQVGDILRPRRSL